MSNGMLTENVDCMNCMLLNVTLGRFSQQAYEDMTPMGHHGISIDPKKGISPQIR
jgi:hypothetical protein